MKRPREFVKAYNFAFEQEGPLDEAMEDFINTPSTVENIALNLEKLRAVLNLLYVAYRARGEAMIAARDWFIRAGLVCSEGGGK